MSSLEFRHQCDSTCIEDHNADDSQHAKDCDCDYCHEDWHNHVIDWAICVRCEMYLRTEEMFLKASKGGKI